MSVNCLSTISPKSTHTAPVTPGAGQIALFGISQLFVFFVFFFFKQELDFTSFSFSNTFLCLITTL